MEQQISTSPVQIMGLLISPLTHVHTVGHMGAPRDLGLDPTV